MCFLLSWRPMCPMAEISESPQFQDCLRSLQGPLCPCFPSSRTSVLFREGQDSLLALTAPWMVTGQWQAKAQGRPTVDACPVSKTHICTHLCIIGTSLFIPVFREVKASFLVAVSGIFVLSRRRSRKPQGRLSTSHCPSVGVCSLLKCDVSNFSGEKEQDHGEGWAVSQDHSSAEWLCSHTSLKVCAVPGKPSCERDIFPPIECRLY